MDFVLCGYVAQIYLALVINGGNCLQLMNPKRNDWETMHNLNVNVNSTFSVSTMSAGSFDNMIQKPTLRKHTKFNLFCHILYIYRNIYIYIIYYDICTMQYIFVYDIFSLYILYIYMYVYVCVCNMTYITHIYRYRHIWYMKLESNL